MSRKRSPVLTDHELRLMDVLWRKGKASVAEVVAALPPPRLTYSTVLTTLRTLEQKGHINHVEEGRAYIYRPLIAREDAARSALRYLVDRFFGKSAGALAVALLDKEKLSDAELAELTKLIQERKAAK